MAVLSAAGISSAATVSYIAGDSIWLSNPTGTQKKKLAGPTSDGRVWRELAQSDNGKVLAVRREPGKISQLNSYTLFGPSGAELQQGSLTHENGWTTYAYPVSLDLANNGVAVYGYANQSGIVPNATFGFGTYVRTVENSFTLEPFKIASLESPTLFGKRVIATANSTIYAQESAENDPFSYDFVSWLNTTADYVSRTDVSAHGKVVGIEMDDKIALLKVDQVSDTGVDSTVLPGDCFLPVQGPAGYITISQDGKDIAWKDDRGVVSAGVPDFSGAEPCVLTRPATVLAANGTYPSIGAAKIPAGGGGGGDGLTPVPTVPGKIKAAALKSGIWITVKVGKAGPVSLTGKVGKKVVARGSTRAKKAGKVKVRLKAVGAFSKKPQKLRGKTLVIKVTSSGKSKTVKRVLK